MVIATLSVNLEIQSGWVILVLISIHSEVNCKIKCSILRQSCWVFKMFVGHVWLSSWIHARSSLRFLWYLSAAASVIVHRRPADRGSQSKEEIGLLYPLIN